VGSRISRQGQCCAEANRRRTQTAARASQRPTYRGCNDDRRVESNQVILRSLPEAVITPRTIDLSFNHTQGFVRFVFSFTRVAWPAGPVGSIELTKPDGSLGGACSFSGGVVLDRQGLVLLSSSLTIEANPLPLGTWGVQVIILQTVTTAVMIEGF
jgi:hypothetical protein